MEKTNRPDWGKLFQDALREPGRLGACYRLFHRYSLGNQVLAMEQMVERGIQIGPIASFNGWRKAGRIVRKGERALALWMPIVKKEVVRHDDGSEKESVRQFFVMKNHWFALAQTEPIDPENPGTVPTPEIPAWDKAQALAKLGITEVAFEHTDGNCQGFARPRMGEVAVNPMAAMPWKTLFHEMAHCLLHGETAEAQFVDGGFINRSIQEAEAEAVAMLCCATLGLPGVEEARGYIQDWLESSSDRETFIKKSASRVFSAADKILKAGAKTEASQEGEGE
jgi:antirestriction protein ArdC